MLCQLLVIKNITLEEMNNDNFDKRPGLNEDIFKGDDQVKMKETMLKLQRPS